MKVQKWIPVLAFFYCEIYVQFGFRALNELNITQEELKNC